MRKMTLKGFWEVLKSAGGCFLHDKVTKLSASLAYYMIFSLGPMLIVIIYLANIFVGEKAAQGTVYDQMKELVGSDAALQIQQIITNAAISGNSAVAATIGFITLFIGATTVFGEMQDSINTIWNLRVKTEKGWLKMLMNRLLSFSVIISLGFLLLVSLIINVVLEALMGKLQELFPQVTFVVVYIANILITLLVVSALFAIIFKVLPDAVIRWSDVAVGSVFTAILFMIGKFGITFYISKSNVSSAYGTAGSLVVLLLWIYYSSIILYFGAEFTKAYAVKFGHEIKPNDYAVTVQVVHVERGEKSIQENEHEKEEVEKEVKRVADDVQAKKASV